MLQATRCLREIPETNLRQRRALTPCPTGRLFDPPPRLGNDPLPSQFSAPRTGQVYTLNRYPQVAAALNLARAQADAAGCVVRASHCGDFLSPSVLSSLDGGKAHAAALELTGFDFVCLGNHEFDWGVGHCASVLKVLASKGARPKVLNANVVDPELEFLPKSCTVPVGDRTVLFAGFLGANTTIYPPSKCPAIQSVEEAMAAVWQASTQPVDLFVPLTHQLVSEDRITMKWLHQNDELRSSTPIILGGHDHELTVLESGSCTLLKCGCDCDNLGVVDIFWDFEGARHQRIEIIPIDEFPPDPELLEWTKQQHAFVASMMREPLAEVPRPMSSRAVRFEATLGDVPSFLLSLVKRGLEREGVEAVLLQGGGVRGNSEYAAGSAFTMGDLFSEFGFDTRQALIQVPGEVKVCSPANRPNRPGHTQPPAANGSVKLRSRGLVPTNDPSPPRGCR